MDIILAKLALALSAISSLLFPAPKFGGTIMEVSSRTPIKNEYVKLDVNKNETILSDLSAYQNVSLKQGEVAFARPVYAITTLTDNQFFNDGKDDASSTLIQIKLPLQPIQKGKASDFGL